MNATARPLTEGEIKILERNGCSAFSGDGAVGSWDGITACEGFRPETILRTRLIGNCTLGRCSISGSSISACSIGDGASIDNSFVSDYDIAPGAVIRDCSDIGMDGPCSFGIGTEANVVNEAGGRSVRIFPRLTAPLAYMLIYHKACPESGFAERINRDIEKLAAENSLERGRIGKNSRIVRSGIIRNVKVGDGCLIECAAELREGTIADGCRIGPSVIARRFVTARGAEIDSGAIIEKCFIGESVRLGTGFSASDSLFFANSELFNGEACSVFAGPFTVSHHKATLLIAGYFSFFNAGSGSNQSNHMYKNGPRHSGFAERGCKFASGSYLMWPSKLGMFSTVIGKHMLNFDSSPLPFSYLSESGGHSFVKPAIALAKAGTIRDMQKWPGRDRRTEPRAESLIYDFEGPLAISRLIEGAAYLEQLLEKGSDPARNISLLPRGAKPSGHVLHIKEDDIIPAINLYKKAARAFVCKKMRNYFDDGTYAESPTLIDELKKIAKLASPLQQWADLAGLVMPRDYALGNVMELEAGSGGLEAAEEIIRNSAASYPLWARSYETALFMDMYDPATPEEAMEAIEDGLALMREIDGARNEDARKEEEGPLYRIGFGCDFVSPRQDYERVASDRKKQ